MLDEVSSSRYPPKEGPWSSHSQIARLMGDGLGRRVVDVGCASGDLLSTLQDQGWIPEGLEPDPVDAELAVARGLPVHAGTLDEVLPRLQGSYQAVVAADVIEHMADPSAALDAMRSLLAPEGRLVLSVPNVAHMSVRLELLMGSFQYRERGPLDRTHLRFFTRKSLVAAVRGSGFEPVYVGVTPAPLEILESALQRRIPSSAHHLNQWLTRAWTSGLAYQYLVIARKV